MAAERTMQHNLDLLSWPVLAGNWTVIAWFQDLWAAAPGPTAIYTVVTTGFMLFQMADKMGWLERLKRSDPKQEQRK